MEVNIDNKILSLKEKITELILLYERSNDEKAAFENELNKLKKELENKNELIKELEENITNLNLAGAIGTSSEGNDKAKEKINRLVRDIENCIALLNR